MFRFNNPDALMVLALVAAAWMLVRAIEDGRTKWLVWCGALIGLAFLAKMLQAFLVLPAFAGAYLVAGPVLLRRFIGGSLGGGLGGTAESGSDAAQEIAAWVAQNYTAVSVGGVTVYDLTA